MSDAPDKQEKVFDPTPQRIKKAHEEGNVFRSKELLSAGSLLTGMVILFVGGPFGFDQLHLLTARVFASAVDTVITVQSVPDIFAALGLHVLLIMMPFFLALMVTGVGMNVAQTGWNVTLKPLAPKGNRVSPIQGLKRIFSARGLFEVFKSLAKVAVLGPIVYYTIIDHMDEIMVLHMLPLESIISSATWWIAVLLGKMLMALLLLAGVDFAFEKWRYKEDLKMTQREVKDETKSQEGDPHMKSKRQQVAREMRRRPRLDHAVLQADVVITNPTHYALALRYDPSESPAPRVIVKGIRKRALRIKALALEHGISMIEDRPLARALYDSVPEGQEIPEELYIAVAAVLAEIYKQK
jgi:flagellar biosynthetic protein FlhB